MITQEQLQELHAALGAAHGGAAGDYLGVAWLMQEFSLAPEVAVAQVSVAPQMPSRQTSGGQQSPSAVHEPPSGTQVVPQR